jgi:hypothetical protein
MVGTRDKTIKKELIKYISSCGIAVNTVTKARGNKGFFREGRIDISRTLDDSSAIKTLVHEFAHFVNYRLDNKINNLSVLFEEDSGALREELLAVTNFVDENSLCVKLNIEREKHKKNITNLSNSIKKVYPDFSLSKEFKPFKKYSRWSNVSYLEKYDRVKLLSWFSYKVYSISTVKKDFPNIPEEFVDYLKLKSEQRKRAKISRRITKLNKYYESSAELFARFIEGLYLDIDMVKQYAPTCFEHFSELYNKGYYDGLRGLFEILEINI